MLNRLLPILIVSLATLSGYAADVCNTLPECLQLKALVDARVQVLQAGLAPKFGEIARNANGSIRLMVQSSEYMRSIGKPLPNGELGAVEYCKDPRMVQQPAHLPSARELAQLVSRRCTPNIEGKEPCGAAGISETAKNGYYPVNAKNADGKVDNFYFNEAGYKRPAGDLGNNWFWSSSVYSSSSGSAYCFVGINGFVDVGNRILLNAVRCVAGR